MIQLIISQIASKGIWELIREVFFPMRKKGRKSLQITFIGEKTSLKKDERSKIQNTKETKTFSFKIELKKR